MFDSPLSASAYEVLGVEPTVDDDTLRKAYRLRLRQTHPDAGGDSAQFILVQRAWDLVGTAQARAAYDRGHGFAAASEPTWTGWRAPTAARDTRPRARSYGHPGGWRRERYLDLLREWAGRGVHIPDPYDPALVRQAPQTIRRLLADALAEEATARTIAELGMGYTVWHDVENPRARHPDEKVDHLVLGPSGLYGVLSEDAGGPVTYRRGELIGDGVDGAPLARHLASMRGVARAARVKFSGAIAVLPDEDLTDAITEPGKVRGLPVAIVSRSALGTILRRGVTGARDIGGNEVFDIRTRLQQTVRFA